MNTDAANTGTKKTKTLTQNEFLEQLSNAHVEVYPLLIHGNVRRGTKNKKRPNTAEVVIPDTWIDDVFDLGIKGSESPSVFIMIKLDRREYQEFAEEVKARKENGRENQPTD